MPKAQELVVVSGKGGTGKTSITASFAALASNAIMVDCDVDASDLHLILSPVVKQTEPFYGGKIPVLNPDKCTGCLRCAEVCKFQAISGVEASGDLRPRPHIDPILCEGCGVCAYFCPHHALIMEPEQNGEWYISDTRFGTMVHAALGVAQENSGKLVSTIRKAASKIANEQQQELVIIDGSPGIGCPVIASITNATMALIVTEPTLSGLHDLERIEELCRGFDLPTMVIINKHDINREVSQKISRKCQKLDVPIAGYIRYDPIFTMAQLQHKAVVEMSSAGASQDIRDIWTTVGKELQCKKPHYIKEIPIR